VINQIRRASFGACKAALAFTLAFAVGNSMAQDFNFKPITPEIVSARTEGSGGPYCATEVGFDTLSTNPAALAFVDREWSFARLACKVSGPLFDIPSVFQADDMTTGILDLVADNNGVYIGLNETGPIAIGKVDRNFGFGVFNRGICKVDVPSIAKATFIAGEEILLVGGYGLVLYEKGPHLISGGLQLKGFFQSFVREDGTAVAVLETFTDFDTNDLPSILSTGFGVDVGAIYRFDGNLSFAFNCKDLYTPVFSTRYANYGDFLGGDPDSDTIYTRIDPNLSIGVAYSIPLPAHWTTISGWNVMFDYRDALSSFRTIHRNPILNVATGTEIEFLDVVYFRLGVRDAYLSTGLGLDLTACKIDFAIYGTELGLEPGNRPLLNIALSAAFEY